MAKRRFLPTRRRSTQQILDDLSDENDDDEIHFNNKRYFLKSKRYFLNSKRFTEPKDVRYQYFVFFIHKNLSFFTGINIRQAAFHQHKLLFNVNICSEQNKKRIIIINVTLFFHGSGQTNYPYKLW